MNQELQAAKTGGSFDEAPPLQRMRRWELWALADKYNIPYPQDATKREMLLTLDGVDFSRPPAEQVLEKMGVFDLRKECVKRGINYEKTDTRQILVEKLV